jgi:hypothetical protein
LSVAAAEALMPFDEDENLFDAIPDPAEDPAQPPIASAPTWKLTGKGHALDEAISALQKAIRRDRPLEAIYWGHEVWEKFPAYFWRRCMVIASEDAPDCAVQVGQLAWNAQLASKNFARGQAGGIIEAHAILLMCRCEKSKEPLDAVSLVREAKTKGLRIEPPDCAIDLHTARGKRSGKDLKHFIEAGRLIAGKLGRNAYELMRWNFKQPYLPRPGDDGGDPDIEIPIENRPYFRK